MFECSTDRFLLHLATIEDGGTDPERFLEDALDRLGRHAPMAPSQEEILTGHLRARSRRKDQGRKKDRKRIPEAA